MSSSRSAARLVSRAAKLSIERNGARIIDHSAFYESLRSNDRDWKSPAPLAHSPVDTGKVGKTGKAAKAKAKAKKPFPVSAARKEGKFSTFYQSLEQDRAPKAQVRGVAKASRRRSEKGEMRQRPLSRGGSRTDGAPATLELTGAQGDYGVLNGTLTLSTETEVHGYPLYTGVRGGGGGGGNGDGGGRGGKGGGGAAAVAPGEGAAEQEDGAAPGDQEEGLHAFLYRSSNDGTWRVCVEQGDMAANVGCLSLVVEEFTAMTSIGFLLLPVSPARVQQRL